MKVLVLLVILFLLVGCGSEVQWQGTPEDPDIMRVVMEEDGVVCYKYEFGYGGGISCLPLSWLEVDDGR